MSTIPRKRPQPENHSSILLGRDENETIFGLLGNKCQSLATAVVQIYLSEQPSHTRWQKKLCGVACFVKDNVRKSYFIRIFSMDEYALGWEQELYTQCDYKTPRPYFHTFEAETCQAGLNFADEQEAFMFQNVIQDRLSKRMNRIERKKTVVQHKSALPTPPNMSISEVLSDLPTPPVSSYTKSSTFGTLKSRKKDKKKDKKLTKADIGEPTNFQHVTHVGWDPTKGLDGFQKDNDPYLQKLFNMVGISEKQLQDEDTRKFIYEFIDRSGMGDMLREMSSADQTDDIGAPPPVPARQPQQATPTPSRVPPSAPTAPPAPPARLVVPPPPPSISTTNNKPKTSPVITRQTVGPPPPPPPTRALPQIPTSPAPPSRSPSMRSGSLPPPPPPPPSGNNNLPPPPPPITGGGGGAPPPPPPPPPVPPVMEDVGVVPTPQDVPDGRSALLLDIRSGLTLKKVTRDESNRSSGDSRSELLDQIRHGIELKSVKDTESDLNPQVDMRSQLLNQIRDGVQLRSVSESETAQVRLTPRDQLLSDIRKGVSLKHVETRVGDNPRPASQQGVLDGMASALAKALADRSRAIHSSDDSGDDVDDDDDDDDWDV